MELWELAPRGWRDDALSIGGTDPWKVVGVADPAIA